MKKGEANNLSNTSAARTRKHFMNNSVCGEVVQSDTRKNTNPALDALKTEKQRYPSQTQLSSYNTEKEKYTIQSKEGKHR